MSLLFTSLVTIVCGCSSAYPVDGGVLALCSVKKSLPCSSLPTQSCSALCYDTFECDPAKYKETKNTDAFYHAHEPALPGQSGGNIVSFTGTSVVCQQKRFCATLCQPTGFEGLLFCVPGEGAWLEGLKFSNFNLQGNCTGEEF